MKSETKYALLAGLPVLAAFGIMLIVATIKENPESMLGLAPLGILWVTLIAMKKRYDKRYGR